MTTPDLNPNPPSLADALAQLNPYQEHHLYPAAVRNVSRTFDDFGPWEAAVKATGIAELFEDAALRARLSPSETT